MKRTLKQVSPIMQLTIRQEWNARASPAWTLGGAGDGGYRAAWPLAIEDLITQVQQDAFT